MYVQLYMYILEIHVDHLFQVVPERRLILVDPAVLGLLVIHPYRGLRVVQDFLVAHVHHLCLIHPAVCV